MTSVDLAAGVTQAEFAELVGISQQQVAEFVRLGVLTPGAPVGRWLLSYTSRLREEAAGRSAEQARERARFERLKADHQDMINQQKRRELVPADLLEQILADFGRRIVVILEALPGRIHRELPDADPAAVALVQDEVIRARNEASELAFPEEVVDAYLRRAGAPEAESIGPVGVSSAAAPSALAMG